MSLLRVLRAYAVYDQEVEYCQGMNFLAGLLLTWMPNEATAYAGLVVLMQQQGLRDLYKSDLARLQVTSVHTWPDHWPVLAEKQVSWCPAHAPLQTGTLMIALILDVWIEAGECKDCLQAMQLVETATEASVWC